MYKKSNYTCANDLFLFLVFLFLCFSLYIWPFLNVQCTVHTDHCNFVCLNHLYSVHWVDVQYESVLMFCGIHTNN